MESQPQNPEFKINPENFHSCTTFWYLLHLHTARAQLSLCIYLQSDQSLPSSHIQNYENECSDPKLASRRTRQLYIQAG